MKGVRHLKIAITTRNLPGAVREKTGGAYYMIHNFANALMSQGHDVTVFSLDPPPSDALYEHILIKFPKIFLRNRLFLYYLLPFFIRGINFDKFDIIHTNGDDWCMKRSTRWLRCFYGSSWDEARTSGNFLRKYNHYILYLLEVIASKRCAMSVGISNNTKKTIPVNKVIHCPVSDHFSKLGIEGQKTQHPSILFVGTIEGRKRGRLLVDVFINQVLCEFEDAKLYLVADTNVKHPNIINFHNVSTEELIMLYGQSWIFCLPSSYEGFGIPYAEALCAGTAIVSTENYGACEVLKDGQYGVITSVNELGEAIIELLHNEDLRNDYASSGVERGKDFHMKNYLLKLEEVYKEMSGL